MQQDPDSRGVIRFGAFEWDPERVELRRNGARIRLSGQPLEVLTILIEHADRLVTREALRSKLWGERTFVDFEQGLNTAVARLRQVLSDSADDPRYITTVSGRGYRFIAPISQPKPATVDARHGSASCDRRTWIAGSLGLALGASAAYLAIPSRPEPPTSSRRFPVSVPPGPPLLLSPAQNIAISSDGQRIVYRASLGGSARLYTRSLGESQGRFLPGEDVFSPFFSPDGSEVGFYEFSAESLMRVSMLGGAASRITGPLGFLQGAAWGRDGRIVFATADPSQGLMRVDAAGGEPISLTQPEAGFNHVCPDILPGGRFVLFAIVPSEPGQAPDRIAVFDSETREVADIARGSHPTYVPTGHIVYVVEDNLLAFPFDAERLSASEASASVVVRGLETSDVAGRVGQYSVSQDGSLLVVMAAQSERRQLVWVDRDADEHEFPAPLRAYTYPRISGHGHIALNSDGGIVIWDEASGDVTPFVSGPRMSLYPVWSDDGRSLLFTWGLPLTPGLYVKATAGDREAELIDDSGELRAPYFFSSSGREIVLAEQTSEGVMLRMMSLQGDNRTVDLLPDARNAVRSPDGLHMAYQSNASDRDRFDVFVRSFPEVENYYEKVSVNGGIQPVWSPTGNEIFYIEPGARPRMMVVDVLDGQELRLSPPRALFEWPYYMGELGRTYDVSTDGQRFLAIRRAGTGGTEATRQPQIEIVLDWFSELTAAVPP